MNKLFPALSKILEEELEDALMMSNHHQKKFQECERKIIIIKESLFELQRFKETS